MSRKRVFTLKDKKNIQEALLSRGSAQESLFQQARQARDEVFSGRVEIRSVIEYSNICRQACNYCGMNRHSRVRKYIMEDGDFSSCMERLYNAGRRVIMIQTGENRNKLFFNRLFNLLRIVKNKYPDLTIIGSLGNLSENKYMKLAEIGIERYLLKFETSDPRLYRKIKPSDTLENRLRQIKNLKKLGFQVSSGNITGLPGQTLRSLAEDILLLKEMALPMGSTSAFIPNNMSNYADYPPADINLALNFMAILRISCPSMIIPTTSSLELVVKDGQYLGLMAGANSVTLHDGTPKKAENKYVIYKEQRYSPKDILFKITRKAGLDPSPTSLLREKPQDTLFYKLVNANLRHNRAAVYYENRKYTYGALLGMISKFCSFLEDNKISEGQTVLLAAYDSIEFIVIFLSCIRLGIITAIVDPQAGKNELDSILSELRPHRIFATAGIGKKIKDGRVLEVSREDSGSYFFSLLKKYRASGTYANVDRNNTAIILYTSGTTGRPKGVIHSYKDLLVETFPRAILRMSGRDRVFSCSRIHTSFGLGNSLLFPFRFGAGVILSKHIPNPFSIRKILDQKPTLFFAVPSVYDFLISRANIPRSSFKSVRLFIASGEKFYGDIPGLWNSAYNKKIVECYGSTEMCHSFISNIPGKEKDGSCGKALEGFAVKLGENGRLCYKGPSLTKGYYGDKKLTGRRISDGWFESDDIAKIDGKGYVFIKGRSNLVFKSAGKWISALDIEEKLGRCKLIKAALVTGQAGVLSYYICLNKEMDEDAASKRIRHYCVANLKIGELPGEIHILRQMPETREGKIDRKRLIPALRVKNKEAGA